MPPPEPLGPKEASPPRLRGEERGRNLEIPPQFREKGKRNGSPWPPTARGISSEVYGTQAAAQQQAPHRASSPQAAVAGPAPPPVPGSEHPLRRRRQSPRRSVRWAGRLLAAGPAARPR